MAKQFVTPNNEDKAKQGPSFSFEKIASVRKPKQKTKFGAQESMLEEASAPNQDDNKVVNAEDELIEQIAASPRQKEEVVSEDQKQKLEEATKIISKNKGKKKKFINLAFLIVNIVIVVVILLNQSQQGDGVIPFKVLWQNYLSFEKVLIMFIVWFGVMMFEALKFEMLIYDSSKRHRFALAYKTAALGRYYDCVTPMASGGQPFQVFYLKAGGLTSADALSVPIGKYVFGQIAFVILGVIVVISSAKTGLTVGNIAQNVVSAASWVGIALNAALISTVAFFSVSKKISRKLVSGILRILERIKLIKHYEKQLEKVNKFVGEFQSAFRTYAKNKTTLVLQFLYSFAGLLLNYTIPFVIYTVFMGYDPTIWWSLVTICMMVDLASSFIPLPGGTGASELSFTALMASLFTSGMLFWALIFWRILTYYVYIIQGPLLMAYDYVWGTKRNAWLLKKWQLEEESKNASVRQQISIFDKSKRIGAKNNIAK